MKTYNLGPKPPGSLLKSKPRFPFRLSLPLPLMPSTAMEASLVKAHHRNFRFDTWKEKKKTLKKYLIHTAASWKLLQVQWPLIGRCAANQHLVHIVKGGETLTSISRYYGVSILEIAAENDNIIDIDFVLEGERLSIPVRSEKLLTESDLYGPTLDRCRSLSNIQWTHESQKVLSKLSSCRSQIANPTGYLLVLVPLIVLCISFIIKTFHDRAIKKMKCQNANKSQAPRHGLRTDRWRTVLDDHIIISDTLDTSSGENSGDPFEEDHSPTCSREMSHEYSKHESAYLKFLSECGMSKWGYFRGGSSE